MLVGTFLAQVDVNNYYIDSKNVPWCVTCISNINPFLDFYLETIASIARLDDTFFQTINSLTQG